MSTAEFKVLEYKLRMITLELKSFDEIFHELERLEKWHVANLVQKNDVAMQISQVDSSDAKKIGILKKKDKDSVLTELSQKLSVIEEKVVVGEELLRLAYANIWEKEVWTVKSLKRYRLQEILAEFSRRKINKIQKELQFWKAMVTVRLSDELLTSQRKNKRKESN